MRVETDELDRRQVRAIHNKTQEAFHTGVFMGTLPVLIITIITAYLKIDVAWIVPTTIIIIWIISAQFEDP